MATATVYDPSQTEVTNGQKTTGSTGQYYGDLTQLDSGPSGLLYTLADELIQVYLESQAIEGEIAITQTKVQKETVVSGASTARSKAFWEMLGTGLAAVGSVVGGIISLQSSTATKTQQQPNLDQMQNEIQPEIDYMNRMQSLTHPSQNITAVQGQNNIPQNGPSENAKTMMEGKWGGIQNFDALSDEGKQQHMQRQQEHVNTMTPEGYKTFQGKVDENLKGLRERLTGLQNSNNDIATQQNMMSQMKSNFSDAGFKSTQAWTTEKKGEYEAATQLLNSESGLAGSGASGAREQMNQTNGSVRGALQAAQSGSGSSIYQ